MFGNCEETYGVDGDVETVFETDKINCNFYSEVVVLALLLCSTGNI